MDGEIKSFSDKQKLREFGTTEPALQQMLKECIQSRNTRKEKISTKSTQTIKKMAIGTYISVVTLNVNGLNAPTKRHRPTEWTQNKIHINKICYLQEIHFRPKDIYRK